MQKSHTCRIRSSQRTDQKCIKRVHATPQDKFNFFLPTLSLKQLERNSENLHLNQKILTGFLNSKLIEFWLKHKGKMQGNNYQIDKAPLLELPLIEPNIEKQNQFSVFVSNIIESKQQNPEADTTDLENPIDQLVYQLYELTEEEIKIIENE